jgi:hypothetical protein
MQLECLTHNHTYTHREAHEQSKQDPSPPHTATSPPQPTSNYRMNTLIKKQQNAVPENELSAYKKDNRRTMMTREQKVSGRNVSQGELGAQTAHDGRQKYYTEREVQARIQAALQQQAEQHKKSFVPLSAANFASQRQVDIMLHTERTLLDEIASVQETSDHRWELILRYKKRAKLLNEGNTHHINTLHDDNKVLRNTVAQLESQLVANQGTQACSFVADNHEESKPRDDSTAPRNSVAQLESQQVANQGTQASLSVTDNNEESKHEPEAPRTRTKKRVSFQLSQNTAREYNPNEPVYVEKITCVNESYSYRVVHNHQLEGETTYGCSLWHVGAAAAVAWAVVRAFK